MLTPKAPVMILLDFAGGKWARYCGKQRTTGGVFLPDAAGSMRRLDWHHTLYQVRYTPWEIDSDHPRPA